MLLLIFTNQPNLRSIPKLRSAGVFVSGLQRTRAAGSFVDRDVKVRNGGLFR